MSADQSLEAAAHAVQLALTPVFLLSGVAALLNVFASRLGRVSDQAERLSHDLANPIRTARLKVLKMRARSLDFAVVLAALAGACTCGAVLVLFLGEVKGLATADLLFLVFGGAVVLTMGALMAFVSEMLLAGRGVRVLVNLTLGLSTLRKVSDAVTPKRAPRRRTGQGQRPAAVPTERAAEEGTSRGEAAPDTVARKVEAETR